MTHGPPINMHDRTIRNERVGCPWLWKAVERCRPRLHCFGHIHEEWGSTRWDWGKETGERVEMDEDVLREGKGARVDVSREGGKGLSFGQETLFVNAAIMSAWHRAENAPWVVDLDLLARKSG